MGKNKEFEGRDLQEALLTASEELGIAEPELDYKILEQGRRGLLGFGTKNVRITVMPPLDDDGDFGPRKEGDMRERIGNRRRRSRGGRGRGRGPRPEGGAEAAVDGNRREPRRESADGESVPSDIRHDELRTDEVTEGGGGRGRGRGRGRGGRGRGRNAAGGRGRGAGEARGNDGRGRTDEDRPRDRDDSGEERGGRGRGRGRGGRGRGRGGRGRGRDDRRGDRNRGPRRPAKPAEPVDVSEEDHQKIRGTVEQLFSLMQLEVNLESEIVETGVAIRCDGEDRKLLLEKDGQCISSIRFLLNRMGRRAWPDAGRVQINCNGHSRERDEELVELVREVIQQVKQSGEAKKLHPMNSYERRLAHLEARNTDGVQSRSEGDGETKQVWIEPTDDQDDDERSADSYEDDGDDDSYDDADSDGDSDGDEADGDEDDARL